VHLTSSRYFPKLALLAGAAGLSFSPTDPTAPGRLGANSGLYDAGGDVTLTADAPPRKAQRFQNYAGTLADIRVYNRALSAAEIARLLAATP
jgi:hypothetical protein